jgi:hypothetical protein
MGEYFLILLLSFAALLNPVFTLNFRKTAPISEFRSCRATSFELQLQFLSFFEKGLVYFELLLINSMAYFKLIIYAAY